MCDMKKVIIDIEYCDNEVEQVTDAGCVTVKASRTGVIQLLQLLPVI